MVRRHSNTSGTVAAVFYDRLSAEAAIQQLKDVGFLEPQTGIPARDREQQEEITDGTGTQAASEGVVGGMVGLRSGIGATRGGLAGTPAGMGIPEADARHFEQGLNDGGILLTVEAGERSRLAFKILSESGGNIVPTYEECAHPDEARIDTSGDDASRSLEWTDRRRLLELGYPGPERRLASRRH